MTKLSEQGKILLALVAAFLVVHLFASKRENFDNQKKKFVVKSSDNVYDKFYSGIYDELVGSPARERFEILEIARTTKPGKSSLVLDIGSGTGSHVKALNDKGIRAVGIDKSSAMVEKARAKCPKCKFQKADALSTMTFSPNTFSHIMCLYFTIYYIQDKLTFFKNCYTWLKPGGYLVLHLVNRDQFDPVVPAASPFYLVSPQKYAKERITKSSVKFDTFQYKSQLRLDKANDKATFEETMTDDKTGNVRKNVHDFHMETQKHILSLAKNVGFILKGKIDMVSVQYEYQYLYLLYKEGVRTLQ